MKRNYCLNYLNILIMRLDEEPVLQQTNSRRKDVTRHIVPCLYAAEPQIRQHALKAVLSSRCKEAIEHVRETRKNDGKVKMPVQKTNILLIKFGGGLMEDKKDNLKIVIDWYTTEKYLHNSGLLIEKLLEPYICITEVYLEGLLTVAV